MAFDRLVHGWSVPLEQTSRPVRISDTKQPIHDRGSIAETGHRGGRQLAGSRSCSGGVDPPARAFGGDFPPERLVCALLCGPFPVRRGDRLVRFRREPSAIPAAVSPVSGQTLPGLIRRCLSALPWSGCVCPRSWDWFAPPGRPVRPRCAELPSRLDLERGGNWSGVSAIRARPRRDDRPFVGSQVSCPVVTLHPAFTTPLRYCLEAGQNPGSRPIRWKA